MINPSSLTSTLNYPAQKPSNLTKTRNIFNPSQFGDLLPQTPDRDTFLPDSKALDINEIYLKFSHSVNDISEAQTQKSQAFQDIKQFNQSVEPVESANYRIEGGRSTTGYDSDYIKIKDKESGYVFNTFPVNNKDTTLHFLKDDKSGKIYMCNILNSATISPSDIHGGTFVNKELEKALCEYLNIKELPIEDMDEAVPGMSDLIHTSNGITVMRPFPGLSFFSCSFSTMEEKEAFDKLVWIYEIQYKNITYGDSAIANSYARQELAGNTYRTDGGIFTYGYNYIEFRNEKDIGNSWSIQFEMDTDAKELLKKYNLDKVARTEFKFWMDLLKDEKYGEIASKVVEVREQRDDL